MNGRHNWCGAWLFTDENLTSNVLLLETVLNTSHINSDTFGGNFSLDNAKSNPPLVYLYIGLHKTNLAVRQIGPSSVVYVPRLPKYVGPSWIASNTLLLETVLRQDTSTQTLLVVIFP